MTRWTVEIGDEFEPEFNELHENVRAEVLALVAGFTAIWPAIGKATR